MSQNNKKNNNQKKLVKQIKSNKTKLSVLKKRNQSMKSIIRKKNSAPRTLYNNEKFSGSEFMTNIHMIGSKRLTDGLGVIFESSISPSYFKGSRLEQLSKLYQMYKFESLTVSYRPSVPDTINATIAVYFETDPNENEKPQSAEEAMRIAKAHKGSKVVAVNAPWSIILPATSPKSFYTGNAGDDKRLLHQAKLKIFQIGNGTSYDGKAIAEDIFAGSLTFSYKIQFWNPQLSPDFRVYDGTTQKDIIRVFGTLDSYYLADVSNISAANNHIANSRFRNHKVVLDKSKLFKEGKGSYLLIRAPVTITIANTVKSLNSYAPSRKEEKSDKLISELVSAGDISTVDLNDFFDKAFEPSTKPDRKDPITNIVSDSVHVIKDTFDVAKILLPAFLANTTVGATQVNVTYSNNTTTSNQITTVGSNVVYFDGVNAPFVEELMEFEDTSHAGDTNITFSYAIFFLAFKLYKSNENKYVDSRVPLRYKRNKNDLLLDDIQ